MIRIGVIGGGQLARMMQPAAIALGLELRVLAESENSSAHQAASLVGDYMEFAVLEQFSKTVDVITFDHEHVPVSHLAKLEDAGVLVRPGSAALIHAQNKLIMRQAMERLGLPQPIWQEVCSENDLQTFLNDHGQAVVKTPIGGYDGKGVRVVSKTSEVADWLENLEQFGGSLLAEQKIEFKRELSQLSARNTSGEFTSWPLVQTIQQKGVCSEVIAPAPGPADFSLASKIAQTVAEGLSVTGVMAVELFEDSTGRLLINELAMRPHNSGHFSIEGSVTSQFEQHLRAVANLPLGSTEMKSEVAVMVNLLGVDDQNTFVEHYSAVMKKFPKVKFHSYEKSARAGRKMGHLTTLGTNAKETLEMTIAARDALYRGGV
jgi:5-(carboxyamino)imidazole ribonucleotide synthase